MSIVFEKNGEKIIFDDFVNNIKEHKSYWVSLCPECQKKYKNILGKRISESGAENICSVKECCNEAEYYVDFKENEVSLS